jgi:C1A family cysteine protease
MKPYQLKRGLGVTVMALASAVASAQLQKGPDLNTLRLDLQKQKISFTIGQTSALQRDLKQITGDIIPPNIQQIANAQEPISKRALELDQAERESAVKLNSSLRAKIYEFQIVANPNMKRWDWRTQGKVSPVKDQNPAGTCWAFSVMGALESSWLIRNNKTVDASEQFMVSYSGAGNTGGGDRAPANAWLVANGTTDEATCPYNATMSTSTPASTPTPYDALAWGFVDAANDIPSVQKIKEALCEHGPVEASLYADGNFQAYTGGIFDHVDTANTNTNHAILIIGWDDSKQSWIIKNSWGNDWGESCDYGSGRGFMYIKYGTHKIGRRAMWVKAKSVHYFIKPELLKSLTINPLIKANIRPILR